MSKKFDLSEQESYNSFWKQIIASVIFYNNSKEKNKDKAQIRVKSILTFLRSVVDDIHADRLKELVDEAYKTTEFIYASAMFEDKKVKLSNETEKIIHRELLRHKPRDMSFYNKITKKDK
jgi:hypothetical protein